MDRRGSHRRVGQCKMRIAVGAVTLGTILFLAGAARATDQPDLSNLSIEQLAQIKVTSVSKQAEPLAEAPASLYVIDHDQIVRSGALTIPEILRLAPNLQVYQQSPSKWVVTARGLNGWPFARASRTSSSCLSTAAPSTRRSSPASTGTCRTSFPTTSTGSR